jgi:hypothetical protein
MLEDPLLRNLSCKRGWRREDLNPKISIKTSIQKLHRTCWLKVEETKSSVVKSHTTKKQVKGKKDRWVIGVYGLAPMATKTIKNMDGWGGK